MNKNSKEEPDLAERFEQKFRELIARERERRGITKTDFAKLVAKGRRDPRRALYHLEGKQRITLTDAYRIIEALGYEFEMFCLKVRHELELENERGHPRR